MAWAEQFIDVGALAKLCELGSEVPELNIESGMEITKNTRNLTIVLFSKLYDNMYYDKARDKFSNVLDAHVK